MRGPTGDPKAAAEALARVPMFAALDPVDLAKLAGVLDEVWLEAGSVVFEAGGAGDALYILNEGVAERRIGGATVGEILPLQAFGQLALFTDEPRSASVVARTAVRLWMLPRQRLDPLLRSEPELLLHLTASIGIELAKARRTLGELQTDIDCWIGARLDELSGATRTLVEALAMFETLPAALVPRLALALASAAGPTPGHAAGIAAVDLLARTPFAVRAADGYAMPAAVRAAVLRRLDGQHRRAAIATAIAALARELEQEHALALAAAAWQAAGAPSESARLNARLADLRAAAAEGFAAGAAARPVADAGVAAASATPRPPLPAPGTASRAHRGRSRRVVGLGLAVLPVLFWWSAPPEGLSTAGWQALLTVISAAILFATEALPEEIIALGLIGVWAVAGLVAPRVALDGFASESWMLVLAVLAIGAAVGNTGLLYRVALAAIGRRPAGYGQRCLTLALVGVAVTPALPNATSRTAMAAPMVSELIDALGYARRSRPAVGIAMAGLLGFGQMAGLFLTGSSVGVLVHGLLPADVRAGFGFLDWFVAAAPLHAALLAAALAAIAVLYRPRGDEALPSDLGRRLDLQRAVLGPMRREERVCLLVLAALILGFLTEPWHQIHGAWLGVAALAILALGRALDPAMLRSGVNWSFLLFFGAIASLASVFSTLGVDRWLAGQLAPVLAALAVGPLGFCLALAVAGFLLSFVVRWQAAAPLLALVALPVAPEAGVHPFLAALIALVATQVWFLPYQSTVYLALHQGCGDAYSHAQARPLAWLWGPLVLGSIAAATPAWRAMGMIQ